jgi:hypothetical protein
VTHEWAFSKVHGSFGTIYGPFEEELARTMPTRAPRKGSCRPSGRGSRAGRRSRRLLRWPIRATILVLGDPSRNKVQILSAGGYNTIPIRLPNNWDELTKTAGYRPLSEFSLSAPQKLRPALLDPLGASRPDARPSFRAEPMSVSDEQSGAAPAASHSDAASSPPRRGRGAAW